MSKLSPLFSDSNVKVKNMKTQTLFNAPAFRFFMQAVYAKSTVPVVVYADDEQQAKVKAREVARKALALVVVKQVAL